jgi:hypothetical protein
VVRLDRAEGHLDLLLVDKNLDLNLGEIAVSLIRGSLYLLPAVIRDRGGAGSSSTALALRN